MKKFLFLLAGMMTVATAAQAQWFDFSENKGRCGLGLHLGLAGWNADYSHFGWGPSLTIGGVYLDFIEGGPEHKHYAEFQTESPLFNDSTTFLFNVGYQFPIRPWLRVMPLIGYCQTNAGITDTSRFVADYHNGARISRYHPYTVTPGSRRHNLNVGIGVFVQPFRWAEFYAVGSLHALYGGISINLAAFVDN